MHRWRNRIFREFEAFAVEKFAQDIKESCTWRGIPDVYCNVQSGLHYLFD